MRQLALVPSGCQQWVHNPVAVSSTGDFAYSSALAVYVLGASPKGHVSLSRILARVSHSVTSISWSPKDPNLLAMTCADLSMKVYELDSEQEVAAGTSKVGSKNTPLTIRWSLHDPKALFVYGASGLMVWNYGAGSASSAFRNKSENITAFCQSPKQPSKIAVGYNDGSIYLYDLDSKKGIDIPGETRVTSLAFDPLSKDYLLASYWNGHMKLYMVNEGGQQAPGTGFLKQPTGYRSICFVETMPGSFVTVSDRSGVMQLWNVSRPEPMQRLKAGQAGLQSVNPIPRTSKVVLTVKDGTVMLYNLERRRVEWQTRGGHTETIFGCAFHPDNPNLLATCSYDSTVRLWDLTTQEAIKTFIGAEGVLYSVTWSPDGKFMAASSSTGCTYTFDVEKGTLAKSNKHHAAPTYRVEWHPTEPNLLASASNDKTCAVFRADGTLTRSLKHPKGICAVAWSPHEKLVLATTCEDSCVYVWDVTSSEGNLKASLKGHRARVFNVAWNPMLPGVLLTGSDDTSARVWDLSTGGSVELQGHTSNVRGLLWHTEMPNVCLTGSWDSTIRVWDTRNGACLALVKDHHADVYGLATHRKRPFTVASTSRDTTLRLWDLNGTFPAVLFRAACGQVICGKPSQETAPGELCGPTSAAIQASVASASTDLQRFSMLLGLLSPPGAPAELWDLAHSMASIAKGRGGAILSGQDPQIPHVSTVRMVLNSRAQEKEMRKNVKARGIGNAKKEDVIREAAAAHLIAGNIESYCNLSAEVGDWTEALALAPAVGLHFWQGLMQRRAAELVEEGATLEELKPFLVAGGQASKLIEQLLDAQAYNEAFQIATVNAENGYVVDDHVSAGNAMLPSLRSKSGSLPGMEKGVKGLSVSSTGSSEPASPLGVRNMQAQALMDEAKPVDAACCHLSVNDIEGALDKLHRGHEVVLAAALAIALKSPSAPFHIENLAWRCEVSGLWQLGAQMLRQLHDPAEPTELLAARVASFSPSSRDQIHSELGLKSAASYQTMAATEADPACRVRFLLLAGDYTAAARECSSGVRASLSSGEVPEGLRRALMCVPASQLGETERQEVLLLAFYLGAVKAMEYGYLKIAQVLMGLVNRLGGKQLAEGLHLALQSAKPGVPATIAGSNIPSGGSRESSKVSFISNQIIKGPYLVLEDKRSYISLAEAVMLSHSVSFSPLGTGHWLLV
mmetsp:Transcript_11431/g.32447  ORF Transcript_11431/g.32447 Transcript_11431/m.32447 type:complete len:1189 (+) Transcript_11431:66-3632(+)